MAGGIVLVWTLVLAVTGSGWSLTLLGLRVSSRDPFRPLVAGALLASLGLSGLRLQSPGERWLSVGAAVLGVLVLVLGLTYGTFVVGAADTYGYVSQADLWTRGGVVVPTLLASEARWRDAEWAMTPLGYRPARQPGWMAPVYPIGLPLTMAAAKEVAGERGVFAVVPMLGALLVWLTYLLGRTIHSAEAGLLAAVALAASPIFLLYLMVAMTDVPAAAWWLAAVVLALKPQSRWRLVMSGVMTAVALLTRPNLVALAAPVAVLVGRGAGRRRELVSRLIAWGIPAALGAIAVAIANAVLYGSPLQSGYGDLQTLYSPGYTWTNLTYFTNWIVRTQTPFIFLGIAAVSWQARWCLAFAACVLASYLWYVPFDDWTFLRFLLPALPMLLATAAAALITFVRRGSLPSGSVVAAGLLLVCVGAWEGRTAFSLARDEARYVAAAGEVRKLPPNAVVISNAHSGSVRYYANRITLRYEWLGADEYNEALRTLRTRGHTLYALFDDYEVGQFRRRYAGVTDVSWLDRPPLGVINGRVFLYTVP